MQLECDAHRGGARRHDVDLRRTRTVGERDPRQRCQRLHLHVRGRHARKPDGQRGSRHASVSRNVRRVARAQRRTFVRRRLGQHDPPCRQGRGQRHARRSCSQSRWCAIVGGRNRGDRHVRPCGQRHAHDRQQRGAGDRENRAGPEQRRRAQISSPSAWQAVVLRASAGIPAAARPNAAARGRTRV